MKSHLSVITSDTNLQTTARVKALDCVTTALNQPSFDVAATSIATELASAFQCEHVVLGLRDGNAIKIAAWSGVADLKQEFKLTRIAASAMDEAVDQHSTLIYPPKPNDPPRITLMHFELANAGIGNSILTVPLVSQARIVGALTLLRVGTKTWRRDEITELECLASMVGPVLDVKQRSQDSALTRAWREIRDLGQGLVSAGRLKTKFIAAAVVGTIAAAGLIPITVNVSATAKLEGVIQRSLSAPVDSFIKEVLVRPGDKVTEGQLLMTLADQDLRTEQRRVESELARYRGEQGDAFARQDRSKMVTSQARADELTAQLALIDQNLARTQITAPFAGIVIKGDLLQQIGAPIKRGDVLMVMSPSTDFRIMMSVEDHDIADIKTGMDGKLTLSAMPYEALNIRVDRITPLAKFEDGRNVFEVQASLLSKVPGLRPGLAGVAKIGLDEKSVLEASGERIFGWLRFKLWSLFG